MAQPTPYNRLYDFSDYQEVNPTKPLRGSEVDAEFDAIKLTTDQIRANAALIQRDDGSLANQSVTPDSLSAGTLAMIHQGEYLPRGAWAATTVYAMGDLVTYNAATYLCIAAHTAQAAFPNDLSANRWVLIANGALSGQASAIDLFEGNAATTVYTLSYTYANSNAAVVFVGGVALIPVQDFTISGTTLTFVVAPPAPSVAGRKNVMVRGTGIEAQLAANAAAAAAVNAQGYSTAASGSAAAALASQNAAAASQSAAATSATNAASSATSASSSAAAATTQAASASASAASADASEAGAGSSATAAAASATSASASATTATTQATNAANSATAASNSATSAANSATTATTQAATATTQASNAATSASNASTSATAAGNSATNAATSATSANNSATSATNSANSAASSASSANTSATNAAASQTAAAGSASAASTSATNAATSATAAASSATSAGNSATAAASSQSAAAASAAAAAASYDNFDDRYLGPKSAAPATDNDGQPLLIGALYFNTVTNSMQVYGSSGWTAAGSSVNGTTARFRYIATAGQTTFTGTSTNGLVLAYDAGFVDVYLNGVRLDSTEFTASSGTSIVLASAAASGDELNIVAFGTFSIANTYTQAQSDAVFLPKANPSYTGTLTGGVATLGTNVYDSGAIEIGRMGTGDRVALVDFVSSGTPGAVDFSARVIRNAGVNGSLEIKNTGSGDIALIPDTGASWYIRQNSSTSYGGSLRIGGAGGPTEGAFDFIAESDVRWLARGGRLDCVNGANTAWQAGTFRGNGLRLRTANDLTRFEVRSDGYCFFDNGSGSRGASGYALTTPNNSVANAIRASGYIELQTDAGAVGVNYFGSDVRRKENILPCTFKASELISKIEFIEFDWKPNAGNTGHVDVGVSAQQLQSLDSRLVSELSDGHLMVNEPALITHMAKAIQEQQAIIEQLKARLDAAGL